MNADDPFVRLGCEHRFGLDEARIRSLQRRALASIHPDRASDAIGRAWAMRESAALSEAARTLLDPVKRAESLLRLAGVPSAPPSTPELLVESLEARERIEEARRSGDAERIRDACRPAEERLVQVLAELGRAIDGAGHDSEASSPTASAPRTGRDAGATAPDRDARSRRPVVVDGARAALLLTELRMLRRLLDDASESRS